MSKAHKIYASCTRKVRHDDANSAACEASHMADDRPGYFVTPYPCPYCKGWHVGNRKRLDIFERKVK